MSEQTETANADAQTTGEAAETETVPEPSKDWQAEAEKWKQLARKHETRAKDNASKASKLDQIEEAAKTAEQKLIERAEAAEKKLAALEKAAVRNEIAAAKGLTPAQAKRLIGETREELEADADELVKSFAPKPTDFGGGERGSDVGPGKQLTQNDLKNMSAEQISAARKEGKLNNLLHRK